MPLITSKPPADTLRHMARVVGEEHALLAGSEQLSAYASDAVVTSLHQPAAVFLPATTAQVAELVSICHRHGIGIIPQGGQSGHAGGGSVVVPERDVVISCRRMGEIIALDDINRSITVQAGVTLAQVQAAARKRGLEFPVNIGARESCQIGGNIATNVGGISALRWGSMRQHVLGLEAVLPSGKIWNALREVTKDNAGYSIKDLFIGSEGTLGIVTTAVLQLVAHRRADVTALVGLPSLESALQLFCHAREVFEADLAAFELMHRECLAITANHLGIARPIGGDSPWYCLVEIAARTAEAQSASAPADSANLNLLGGVLDELSLTQCVLASDTAKRRNLWRVRHSAPLAMRATGRRVGHDISVPLRCMPQMIADATTQVRRLFPPAIIAPYAHVGDGNIHLNVYLPQKEIAHLSDDAVARLATEISEIVYRLVDDMRGSVAAEHGIGWDKTQVLAAYRSRSEIELMRSIKNAIDPQGIMNPGKVLP